MCSRKKFSALSIIVLTALSCLSLSAQVPKGSTATISAKYGDVYLDVKDTSRVAKLRQDLAWLASKELDGRRAGDVPNGFAAGGIRQRFEKLGLEQAPHTNDTTIQHPSVSYFHYFPYVSGVELEMGNNLRITSPRGTERFTPGFNYNPAGFSASGDITGDMVFVGYGMTSKDNNYDDYEGIDVAGKVVVMMRYSPDGANPHGAFARAASFTAKTANAREHKASGIIFLEQPSDSVTRPMSITLNRNFLDAGIPAVFVVHDMFKAVKDPKGRTIAQLQKLLDSTKRPASFSMKGYSCDGDIVLQLKRTAIPNVIGIVPGNDPAVRDEIIVVGAHFDHLGEGGEGSLHGSHEPAIHFGADDNASGTVGVMSIAEDYAMQYRLGSNRRTIMFVAFNAEEEGLLGSAFLVDHFPYDIKNVVAMINMDMIGRLDSNKLIVQGTGTSPLWPKMLDSLNKGRFVLKQVKEGFGPSDHSSFYVKDIPVVFFFTGLHADYHRPSDTYEKINFEGEAKILDYVKQVINYIDDLPTRPPFTRVATSASERSAGGFKVYVGSIPDYAYDGKGVRLSGVADGGPAQKAGLKGGDVIVRMAGKEINNLYDYTDILSELKPKQVVAIEVLREGKRVVVDVELGSR